MTVPLPDHFFSSIAAVARRMIYNVYKHERYCALLWNSAAEKSAWIWTKGGSQSTWRTSTPRGSRANRCNPTLPCRRRRFLLFLDEKLLCFNRHSTTRKDLESSREGCQSEQAALDRRSEHLGAQHLAQGHLSSSFRVSALLLPARFPVVWCTTRTWTGNCPVPYRLSRCGKYSPRNPP